MIGFLEGTIQKTNPGQVIISAHGVGYIVHVLGNTSSDYSLEDTIRLWTHLSVRENSMDLFGFENEEELEIFSLLISVSGIGPKTALAVLDTASVPTLRHAIYTGDTTSLTKVSGIGPKMAGKLVLELKDKITPGQEDDLLAKDFETLEALTTLGYTTKEAREALKMLPTETTTVQQKITEALKILHSS